MVTSHIMTTVIVFAVFPAFPNIIISKHYVQFISIDYCRGNRTHLRRCRRRYFWTAQGQMRHGAAPHGRRCRPPLSTSNHQKNPLMKKLLAIIAFTLLSLTFFSCASTARVNALQERLNKYQKMDSLAQDIISRNNVADMDGSDSMAEWLDLHN